MSIRLTKAERISKAQTRIKKDKSFTHEKFLSKEEINYFIEALNQDVFNSKFTKQRTKADRYRLYFMMLFYTGARCSEILDCNICDIKDGEITIRGLKGSDTRTIPLPEGFYKEILNYSNTLPEKTKGFLFNTYFFPNTHISIFFNHQYVL